MEPSTSVDQGSSSKSHCGQERTGLPTWNPKHKIFLSHSGKEKEFVRQLCKDLEAETHQPFFDERSSSLMMGERFAPLIFEAARQCLVAVVVLSEDFLTSKWPMLELSEFIRAKKSHNPHLKLLPLFYKLSPEDLKVESIVHRWKPAWTKIIPSTLDPVRPLDDTHRELNLSLCIDALRELCASNGLKFENFASKVAYREAIVKEILTLVAPNLLDDTSDVIGNERLCKVAGGMFVEDTKEDSNLCGTYRLGLHGMGGLGKTTMCRALCMFYHKDFNGRVFHLELGSRPPIDLLKLVLTKLLRINKDLVETIHTVHEGRKLLQDHMNRQPVFLAIDNITHDHKSHMEALTYLKAKFHVGSMIMITSRSLDVVEELFPSHANAIYCKPMTRLSEEEARLIFLQRVIPQQKLETLTMQEQGILDECLSQCHFLLDNKERQYHPLALQAMADYYHKHDNFNILKWKGHLEDLNKLRLSNASSYIFGILGLQFMTLELKEKLIFLDLCLYIDQNLLLAYSTKGLRWLVDLHEDTPTAINFQVHTLKRSSIINITCNKGGDQIITIHDLYREFAKWYVMDGEGSRCPELGCVYHTTSTISLPYILKRVGPSLSQVQRIYLQNLKLMTFPMMKVQEWCNVVVLEIYECLNLKVLDLHGLNCLRHLELVGLPELESFHFVVSRGSNMKGSNGMLESLQHVVLTSLTSLKQLPNFSLCTLLKTFRMEKCEEFLPKPPQFKGCSQLEDLNLDWKWQWQMEEFKLNTLTSLTSLEVHNWKFVVASKQSIISSLKNMGFHYKLIGLSNCSRLQNLKLTALPITSLLGLEKLTKLQKLSIGFCENLQYIPNISTLVELKKLHMLRAPFQQFPGIERLLELKSLYFIECFALTSLPDLDHLSKLTFVFLVSCYSLKVKPQVPHGCQLKSYQCHFDL